MIIQTASSSLQLAGTWLAVTYLPDRQLSLIMVMEGKVEATPVLDIGSEKMGEPTSIEAGLFWFTAPDDRLGDVGGLAPRQVYTFDQLPPVVQELQLQPWIERIRRSAEEDFIPLPEAFATLGAETTDFNAFLFTSGGGSQDRQALLLSVDWLKAVDTLQVVVATPTEDTRDFPYDPKLGLALLAEAGYPSGFSMRLIVPAGDDQLYELGKQITEDLALIEVSVEIVVVEPSAAFDVFAESVAADERAWFLDRGMH